MNLIAEIGINHNGDIEICKKLIYLAKLSGFKFVKIQKRNPFLKAHVFVVFNQSTYFGRS